jgi:tetratricopeptide (TPR) repeat protein
VQRLLTPLLLGLLAWAGRSAAEPDQVARQCVAEQSPAAREEAFRLYAAGQLAALEERWDEARGQLQHAAVLDASLAPVHFALGQAHMALRQYADAVKAFTDCRWALRCLRESGSGSTGDALALRIDDSIRMLEEAIRRSERERLARAAMDWQELNRSAPAPLGRSNAELQQLEGQVAELREWRKNMGAEPPQLPLSLGNAHFNAGALSEAEVEFEAALRIHPGWGDALNNLSVVYMLTGRLEEAEQAMKQAAKAGVPVNPRIKEEISKRKAERRSKPSPPP